MMRHSGMSHEEIGRALGMSRQNVQLIERRALNKLRVALGSSYRGPWTPYDVEGVHTDKFSNSRRHASVFR